MSLYQEFLLLERNVVNQDDMARVIKDLQDHAGTEPGKKWLQTTLRNWILNNFTPAQKFQDISQQAQRTYLGQLPWLRAAVDRGDELFVLNFQTPGAMRWIQDMQHVVDYFNAHPQERLDRVSVEQAVKASKDWTEQLGRQKAKEEDVEGVDELLSFEDGFRWVRVMSAQALEREGQLMKHCVGSYAKEVKDGKKQILSLRDGQNKPHVTVELQGRREDVDDADEDVETSKKVTTDVFNVVHQVKGVANSAPKKLYLPYIGSLFTKFKLKAARWGLNDLQRISPSIIEVGGRLVDINHLHGTLEGDLVFDTSAHGRYAEVETAAIPIGDGRDLTIQGKLYIRDSSNMRATSATRKIVMNFAKLVVDGDFFAAAYEEIQLPRQLMVNGHCDLHHISGTVEMPNTLVVTGDLVLPKYLDKMPDRLVIKGKLFAPRRWEGKLNIPEGQAPGGVEYF